MFCEWMQHELQCLDCTYHETPLTEQGPLPSRNTSFCDIYNIILFVTRLYIYTDMYAYDDYLYICMITYLRSEFCQEYNNQVVMEML
jgi:hypothetical protein